jgi:predicted nucleotidyltransferase
MQQSGEYKTVPPEVVLAYVAEEAAKAGFVREVILFGSRARGNARPYSDYDLAFVLKPGTEPIRWLAFAETLDEDAPTLCRLSTVKLKPSIRPELLAEIQQHGKHIYGP